MGHKNGRSILTTTQVMSFGYALCSDCRTEPVAYSEPPPHACGEIRTWSIVEQPPTAVKTIPANTRDNQRR